MVKARWRALLIVFLTIGLAGLDRSAPMTTGQVVVDEVAVQAVKIQAELNPVHFTGTCHDADCLSPTRGKLRARTAVDVGIVGDRPLTGMRMLLDADLRILTFASSHTASLRRDGQFVFLAFDPPLPPRSSIHIELEYEGTPAWIWDELIFAGEGLLYPVIVSRFGDIAVNRAPISVTVTVPEGYTVASFGRPTRRGSVSGVSWEWVSRDPLPYLSIVGVRSTKITQRTVGALRLTFISRSEVDVQEDLISTLVGRAVQFYSSLLYPFPLTDLTVVAAPFARSVLRFGAPGVLVIPESLFARDATSQPRDSTRMLSIARELARAYYPVSTNLRGPAALWLSEGLTEYLGLMAVEALVGHDAFVRELDEHRRAYAGVAGPAYCVPPWCTPDPPLSVVDRTNARSSGSRIVVSSKGAFVVHMLRYLLGAPAFNRMLGTFAQRFSGQSAGITDLAAFASEAYGEDLYWFFQEWVLDRALPDYTVAEAVSAQVGSEYRTVIRIRNLGTGSLPVDVWIRTEFGDQTIRRFPVPGSIVGAETLVTVNTPNRVTEIEVDPEKWILQSDYTNDAMTVR